MFKPCVIACVILLANASVNAPAHAKTATKESVPEVRGLSSIPDTPSGKTMKEWLKAVSTGSLDTLTAFFETHSDLEDLKRFPARDRAVMMTDTYYRFGTRRPVRLVTSGELETTIEGESPLPERWMRITMALSPKADHPIAYMKMEPIEAPAEYREAKPTSDREMVGRVQAFTENLVKADRFSGVVLVAKGDKVLFQQAYGYADKAKGKMNTMDTRFGLASMGKMFTAVAVAQLAEAGKLKYSDRLIDLLPDYPNKTAAEKITVHQLLTHTSGLGDFFDKPGIFEALPKMHGPRDFFPFFADEPLHFEPGKGWDYSNAGYVVLGAIIEKVSGQDYFTYIREHVFRPAGMTHSAHDTIHGKVPNLAVAYTFTEGGTERKGNAVSDTGGPAGGGASTAGDLLRFSQALLTGKLVNPKTLETMTAPHAKVTMEKDVDYGYGFMLHNENGHPTFGHGGGFPGVCTQLEVYPKDGYVVVMLSNYDPMMGNSIADKVRRMVAAG